MTQSRPPAAAVLDRSSLTALIGRLGADGREVIGPTRRDGAIVYDAIASDQDLPIGWGDDQEAGRYRLRQREDQAVFGFAAGPDSWKRYLRPPRRVLWRATRAEGSMAFERACESPKYAFLSVRACDISAIGVLDKVMLGGAHADPGYAAVRENALIVAVNCGAPAATCFCASMGTGPKARSGFDLALTELIDKTGHRFLIEAGTTAGATILADLPTRPARQADLDAAADVLRASETGMGRTMQTEGLQRLLAENPEHPRWGDVADRCLACANCTQACPTCFCATVEDHTSLAGDEAERVEVWDSCFTSRFSEVGGGQVRETTRSRYRQWMTHKLSTWVDQFGTFGCVGCGRCIAWCPVGIDITEEAAAIRREVETAA